MLDCVAGRELEVDLIDRDQWFSSAYYACGSVSAEDAEGETPSRLHLQPDLKSLIVRPPVPAALKELFPSLIQKSVRKYLVCVPRQ